LRTAAIVVIALLIGLIIGVRELIEKYQKEKIVTAGEVKVSPLVTPPVVPQPSAPTVAVDAKPAEEPVKEEPAKEEPAVKAAEPEEKPAATAAVTPTPTPEPQPEATPTPAPIVGIPRTLVAPKEIVEPPPTKSAKAEAKPVEAKPIEIKPTETRIDDSKPAQEAKANEPAATPPPSVIKSLKNEIILEALDKVDVEFKVHGQTKRLSLGPTEVHTIRTDGPMVLDFSDGGAVNIILNGRERGVPGDLGKPKQVKLP
jgi:cytoskeleton protein RodZ